MMSSGGARGAVDREGLEYYRTLGRGFRNVVRDVDPRRRRKEEIGRIGVSRTAAPLLL